MRLRTFIFGYILVLAIFLFAKRHGDASPASSNFSKVVDLTRTQTNSRVNSGSYLDAPALYSPNLWSVDQIPAERLIAPLVVLDVRENSRKSAHYQVSVDDIADWERAHGEIPQGAVVVAETGVGTESSSGFSLDAARFLVEGRNTLGLGVDSAENAKSEAAKEAAKYVQSHSVYQLANLVNLQNVPVSGSVAVVAPEKLSHASSARARVLALVR